jgi:nucleotide-binding universal stress UspA family protein
MKVLLGVDNDVLLESVLTTLRWCVRLRPGDEVAVAHVTESHACAQRLASSDPGWGEVARADLGRAEGALSEARHCLCLATWGIAAEFLNPEGPPAAEFLRIARDRNVDLVVVGARGRQERGFLARDRRGRRRGPARPPAREGGTGPLTGSLHPARAGSRRGHRGPPRFASRRDPRGGRAASVVLLLLVEAEKLVSKRRMR